MRLSLPRTILTVLLVVWLLVVLGSAASMGFFGNMFEGVAGGMFGDMFGSTVGSVSGVAATPTVRR
jgi:hypothetical protein